MQKQDFVVRFAGEGGQGVVTSAEGLAQAAAQVGYHVQTFATFPSQILGGPTWTQTRISDRPVLSSGDSLDVLVAFNQEAYDNHHDQVREDGVVVFDSGSFDLERQGPTLGMPFDELAKSTGNARAANMVIIGALAYLVKMPLEYLEQFVKQRFSRGRTGDDEIIRANIEALSIGHTKALESGFSLGELVAPKMPSEEQVLIKGTDAISLGAIAADLDFYVGYPISPATPVLVFMERNLVGDGKFAYQASSEIESIAAILGGGFAGKKAMTATSGPGFSLMSEGIGLAWMSEIPLVVVNVQRGGPATGLPTKTEQSDLQSALHPAHGDCMMPVIAPGTVEESFHAAVSAMNWAERYQGPVVLLSEMALAERSQNIPRPDISKLIVEKRKVYTGDNGYQRYDGSEMSPMPIPGGPGAYVANGSEHDGIGDTTHLPTRHIQMTERRFGKLKLLEDGSFEIENSQHSIAVMPWGATKGPAYEAYEALLQDGVSLTWSYTMYLNPLPPKLLDQLLEKELVIVPELNYQGQFASYLRSLGIRAEAITQYTGLPFKVRDLVHRINEKLELRLKKVVTR